MLRISPLNAVLLGLACAATFGVAHRAAAESVDFCRSIQDDTKRNQFTPYHHAQMNGYEHVAPAIGWLELEYDKEEGDAGAPATATATCTATAIATDAILTADHCYRFERETAPGTTATYRVSPYRGSYFSQNYWEPDQRKLPVTHPNGLKRIEIEPDPVKWEFADGHVAQQRSPEAEWDFAVFRTKAGSEPLKALRLVIDDVKPNDILEIFQHPLCWEKMYTAERCKPQRLESAQVRHACSTEQGSSGAMLIAGRLSEPAGIFTVALHTQKGRPDVVGDPKSATKLKFILDDPHERGTVLKQLHAWHVANGGPENAREISLADVGLPRPSQQASMRYMNARLSLAASSERERAAEKSRPYVLGSSPETNASYVASKAPCNVKGGSLPVLNQCGRLDDFRVRGSSPDVLKRLTAAVPGDFRPLGNRNPNEAWVTEYAEPKPAMVRYPRQDMSLVFRSISWLRRVTSPAAVGPKIDAAGVELAWSQNRFWQDTETERSCEIRRGKTFRHQTFYQPLEADHDLVRLNWDDRPDLAAKDCRVPDPSRTTLPLYDEIDAQEISRTEERTGGRERELLYKLSLEPDNGLVPPMCNGAPDAKCVTMVRFHSVEEKWEGKTAWPVFRRAVADVLRTVKREPDRIVVRIDRCRFLTGPQTQWPSVGDVLARNCPLGEGQIARDPWMMLVEYRRHKGITCTIAKAAESKIGGESRSWLQGVASPQCLAAEAAALR